jgi:hypothetical protein
MVEYNSFLFKINKLIIFSLNVMKPNLNMYSGRYTVSFSQRRTKNSYLKKYRPNKLIYICVKPVLSVYPAGSRGGHVHCGTALQPGGSWVRFTVVLMDFYCHNLSQETRICIPWSVEAIGE